MFNFEPLIEEKEPNLKFKCEIEEGNIEYKLRLDFKNNFSLKKMKNQMSWRFEEGKELVGKRECHYILGIFDNGKLGNLSESEIERTLKIFESIVKDCDATVTFLEKKNYNNSWVAFITLLQIFEKKIQELNIGFVGPKQCGKTTTISNIAYGNLDDGNGSARQNIFRHEHEKNSGYTSCIKKEIIGIKNHTIINYNSGMNMSWENIATMSDKILCLIDLPGSQQYTKTILFGLSSYNFDAFVIFNSKCNHDENKFNNLYIEYANLLNIPYIIVEIDDFYSPSSYISTSAVLNNFNFNHSFKTVLVEEDNFISSFDNNKDKKDKDKKDKDKNKEKDIIHVISNLKPNGIKCINTFLFGINKKKYIIDDNNNDNNIFTITDMVCIPDTGIVYSGEMMYGNLKLNDNVFLTNGNITFNTNIQSIHKKQTFTNNLYTGEMGAIMLSGNNIEMQKYGKNMILTTEQLQSHGKITFKIKSHIKISINNEIIIYINNIVCIGIVENIVENESGEINYTVYLKKNYIIVQNIKKYIFCKLFNNIFIAELLL